jgi:glycosyltransferase involved in cell wall biosynthesis
VGPFTQSESTERNLDHVCPRRRVGYRDMSNILLVSYPFPPSGTIGVSRALAYVRYLRLHGCHVSVLTATNPQTPATDPELCKLLPSEVPVYRAWNPELPFAMRDRIWKSLTASHGSGTADGRSVPEIGGKRNRGRQLWAKAKIRSVAQRLLFPDPQTTWVLLALRRAIRAVKSDNIEVVILNVPPFSTLKIGIALKRRFPQLKIITDFRDEWLGYYLQQIDNPSPHKIRRARELEHKIVTCSWFVSTVTREWVERLRRRYPDEPASKFIYTPNGYEPEMFNDFKPRVRNDDKMVITYFGSVHMNRVYSPKNYLDAIEALPAEVRDRIETRFIGRVRPDAEACLQETKAIVRQLKFMPKLQGLRYLEETDFLLLIATDPTSHAGKLFEYLATSKPILALSPPNGEIDKVLRETGTGWCVDPWDQVAIQTMVLQAFTRWQTGQQLIKPNLDAIRSYSWPVIFANFRTATGVGCDSELAFAGTTR